jgi:hypothetical protein
MTEIGENKRPAMSKLSERQTKHRAKFRAAGFRRVTVWLASEAVAALDTARQPDECRGRQIERLILGLAKKRPR